MSTEPVDDETTPPPILGSWRRLHALVLGALAVTIALLALLELAAR